MRFPCFAFGMTLPQNPFLWGHLPIPLRASARTLCIHTLTTLQFHNPTTHWLPGPFDLSTFRPLDLLSFCHFVFLSLRKYFFLRQFVLKKKNVLSLHSLFGEKGILRRENKRSLRDWETKKIDRKQTRQLALGQIDE